MARGHKGIEVNGRVIVSKLSSRNTPLRRAWNGSSSLVAKYSRCFGLCREHRFEARLARRDAIKISPSRVQVVTFLLVAMAGPVKARLGCHLNRMGDSWSHRWPRVGFGIKDKTNSTRDDRRDNRQHTHNARTDKTKHKERAAHQDETQHHKAKQKAQTHTPTQTHKKERRETKS